MEQARIFIAIALSFLIFILWEVFIVDRNEFEQAPQDSRIVSEEDKTKKEAQVYIPQEREEHSRDSVDTAQDYQIRQTIVNTPLYSVTISEKGATFNSFILKDYKETVDEQSPLKELISDDLQKGTLECFFQENSIPDLNNVIYESEAAGKSIDVYNHPETISFLWKSPEGIVFIKEYSFSPTTYLVSMTIRIKNGSENNIDDQLKITLANHLEQKDAYYGFVGPSGLIDNKMKEVKIDDIHKESFTEGNIKWIALETIYFINSIVPKEIKHAAMILDEGENRLVYNSYLEPAVKVEKGMQTAYEYDVYFGPKSLRLLNQMNNGLDRSINFGMFDFIAKPFLWLMNFIYDYIPNYGIAIIILTIIVKIILWPLGNKSYKSMNDMKKLAPLMKDIRDKYKDDKKKMNQETMALYRTYKINPMGGCLPMILQIPVFFALYRMLYEAIELRHAPFFLWINDLSAPDRLFNFDLYIPLMQPPYGIPVLTIIMGASMFLQQKMAPAPADPTQAKLMTFMPILFTFIFINFSSGLVLYWLVNNLLSMGQQYYVSKKTG
jgi:YidC/Oxa1 family membrane protein insertase